MFQSGRFRYQPYHHSTGIFLAVQDHPAAFNVPPPRKDQPDRLAINPVLFDENASRKTVFGVGVHHWNCSLQNNRAGIQLLIYKMDRAAADFDSVLESLLLGVESRKGREQGRMNIQNPHRESLAELRRQQTHESSQTYQLYAAPLEFFDEMFVELFPWNAFGGDTERRQRSLPCERQTGRFFTIGDYRSDLGIQSPRCDVVGNRCEIRSAPGKQDAEPLQARAPAWLTYNTRSPRDSTTSPISEHGSPNKASVARAFATFRLATTRIMPIPRLNVRR